MHIKTIPITIGFDQDKIIGHAEIDLDLVPKDMEYVFSIGYRVDLKDTSKNELKQIGLIRDEDFVRYLKNKEVY